jgi:zinc/manganese transport system substrate-binding protein
MLVARPAFAAEPLPVIASFSILGDLTQRVGGERVRVQVLVGADADAHVYQPTPADAKTIGRAALVVVNGLGFEGWMERLVKAAGYRGRIVVASRGIEPLKLVHGHGGKHAESDPHAWHDPANARRYVENIATALAEIDPAGKAEYVANAARLQGEIDSVDREIRAQLGVLPEARRTVVTSHDAFGYFARAYGIRFRAPTGVSTEAEASAADVGKLIRQIRAEKIPAVFMENISDQRLLERIRAESGARVGGTLYSDALSPPGGPAATYVDMMRYNARTLAAALTP